MLLLFSVGLHAAQLQCHCKPGYELHNGLKHGTDWQGGCVPSASINCTCNNGDIVEDEDMRREVCANSGGQACFQCHNGYRFESFACVPRQCAHGTAVLGTCTECDAGYELKSNQCTACREYENYQDGLCHSIYKVCEQGKQSNGTACVDCPTGRYKSSTHAGQCTPQRTILEITCAPGQFIDLTSNSTVADLSCSTCPDGTYQAHTNATACIQHNASAIQCEGYGKSISAPTRTHPQTCEDAVALAASQVLDANALQIQNQYGSGTVNPEPAADSTTIEPLGIAIGAGSVAFVAVVLMAYKRSSNSYRYNRVGSNIPSKVDIKTDPDSVGSTISSEVGIETGPEPQLVF